MFNEVTTVFTIITTCIMLYIALRLYRNAPPWIDEKIENTLGTFLEPNEEGKNLVDAIGERFGTSFRMSLLAQKSADVRHTKMIENRVFEAALDKSPELKLGMAALEKLGLGDLATPENLPALFQVAQKYGLLGSIIGGNNPGSSNRQGVM